MQKIKIRKWGSSQIHLKYLNSPANLRVFFSFASFSYLLKSLNDVSCLFSWFKKMFPDRTVLITGCKSGFSIYVFQIPLKCGINVKCEKKAHQQTQTKQEQHRLNKYNNMQIYAQKIEVATGVQVIASNPVSRQQGIPHHA